MFDRFTGQALRVVGLAKEESLTFKHSYVGTEHLLLGLIYEGEGIAARALASQGVGLEAAREQVRRLMGEGINPPVGRAPFSLHAWKVFKLSLRKTQGLGDEYVGTEGILLGLLYKTEERWSGIQVLDALGVERDALRHHVLELLVSG
jgi:ATP-dependent Clp protease ATP-binding subunit ClpC